MERKDWKNKYAAENPAAYRKYQREYRQRRRLEDPEFRKRTSRHAFESLNKDNPTAVFQWMEHIPPNVLEAYKLQETCEICGDEFKSTIDKCLDHDHATGIARGALCRQCNAGLGQFRDNLQILRNAIKYLENTIKEHQDAQ